MHGAGSERTAWSGPPPHARPTHIKPLAPVVTALREQPRGRVEIHLDGAAWRLVPTDAVVRTGLAVGRMLDRETARTLGRELRRADALDRAARALRPRDRSRQALEVRLATAGVPAAARGDALDTLERVGLVDDARVATTRAESLAGRGFGDAAIRHDLEGEGVAAELVERALAGLEPEPDRARALVERRGADLKTARWLAAKGFEESSIEDALGGLDELGAFAGDS
jgi:SOS response regulatory protein OraA/RecX